MSIETRISPLFQEKGKTGELLFKIMIQPITPKTKNCIIEMATADISMQLLLKPRIDFMLGKGYNVRGVCSGGKFASALRAENFPLDVIEMARELSPIKDLVSFVKLWLYFRRMRPSIVFTHTPKAGILGPVAARLAGVPYVVHVVHGYMVHDRARLAFKVFGWIMEKHSSVWSNFCLVQSKEDLVQGVRYKIIQKKRIKYLGNGVNVGVFDPLETSEKERVALRERFKIPKEAVAIGFVGRLVREKGIRELLDAIPAILQKYKNAFFLIAGPVEGEQSDAITPLEIEDAKRRLPVAFPGFCNTRDVLAAIDLFVLPTYREGVPRVLMEAGAMRVPSIATSIRGCREVIVNNVTGWLVEPRSSRELADAICIALALPQAMREAMGTQARNRIVKNFNEKRVQDRFRRICDVLLRRA
jgi:glycosyltransferase involved in cell wall biosynthesis